MKTPASICTPDNLPFCAADMQMQDDEQCSLERAWMVGRIEELSAALGRALTRCDWCRQGNYGSAPDRQPECPDCTKDRSAIP